MLKEDQVASIIERYLAGETQAALAAEFDVAQPTISALLRKRGVPTRPRGTRGATRDLRAEWAPRLKAMGVTPVANSPAPPRVAKPLPNSPKAPKPPPTPPPSARAYETPAERLAKLRQR